MWARQFDSCTNCGTTRHPHAWKGYCTKCAPLARRIQIATSWNADDPDSLDRCPSYLRSDDPVELERNKAAWVLQSQRALDLIRIREARRSGPVSPLDLENQLRRLSRLAGAKSQHLHYGSASVIERTLGPLQRVAVYQLLHEIEEDVPQRKFSLLRLFEDIDAAASG